MPTLMHLPYSPWSERASWALDARGISYEKRRYEPILGEARLWWLRRGAPGPASVPVFVHEGGVISDSRDIARWADTRGTGPRLIPDDAAVKHWEEVTEEALQAGRALAMRRVLSAPDALTDLVPGFLRPTGPIGRWIAAVGVRRTLRKYGAVSTSDNAHRERLITALDRIRAGLAASGTRYLLGEFSFADICAAQALVFMLPPEPPPKGQTRPGIRIARASRRAFRDPDLADEYADLGTWRDQLYAEWR